MGLASAAAEADAQPSPKDAAIRPTPAGAASVLQSEKRTNRFEDKVF